jgi:hypothetical protein
MKNQMHLLFITCLAVMLFATSCKKDNLSEQTGEVLQEGTWRVSLYNDSGSDETNHYTGYSFDFGSNGTISVNTGNGNASGTWSAGNDDSQSKLILQFSTNPLEDLSDDWHIIEQTSTKIRLEDVSGGNGGTDLLTFEKN